MLSEHQVNEIKEFILSQDTSGIVAVEISGSSILPFIDEPHDIDIIVFAEGMFVSDRFRRSKPLAEALRSRFGKRLSVITKPYKTPEGMFDEELSKHLNDPASPEKALWYLRYFYSPDSHVMLKGTFPQKLIDIVHSQQDRRDYLEAADYYLHSKAFAKARAKFGRVKGVYRMLCALYFIENGKYELTDEQKRNVNIAHDCADGWEEMYEYVKNWLEKNR